MSIEHLEGGTNMTKGVHQRARVRHLMLLNGYAQGVRVLQRMSTCSPSAAQSVSICRQRSAHRASELVLGLTTADALMQSIVIVILLYDMNLNSSGRKSPPH